MGTLYNMARSARRDTVDDLYKLIKQLQQQVDAQAKKIESQAQKIEKLEQERDDLEDWAHRLVEQVTKAGLKPVPFHRTRPVEDKQ